MKRDFPAWLSTYRTRVERATLCHVKPKNLRIRLFPRMIYRYLEVTVLEIPRFVKLEIPI